MPIDGVVVHNIVQELNLTLKDGKIDKISQPETDEIILTIRNNGKNYKLLLSSSPNFPRVHLTDLSKQNPIEAPIFCMVLRKHLSGGRILKIEQQNLDRIIKIYIECYDELGNLSTKIIICEIMGRRSNISLINESTLIIVDSIKRLTAEMNSFRQVLPGVVYKYPPFQDKINPLSVDTRELYTRLGTAPQGMNIAKFITSTLDGFSSLSAREICHNAGLAGEILAQNLDDSQKSRLLESTSDFINSIIRKDFHPCIYKDNGAMTDFYCFKLSSMDDMTADDRASISEAIEDFYGGKDKVDRAKQKSSDIVKIVSNNINRCLKKLSIQEEKLLECSQKEKWKLYGDLIMAGLYNIRKGDTRAIVQDIYDENMPTVEIPLDIMLTPVENAQRYYKKYTKEKTAESMVSKQKEENHEEIQYLESLLVNLSNCTEEDEIEEIRNELVSTGYIKKGRKVSSRKRNPSTPMHFVSHDGFDIYVGKNNVQNDYLTTKFADASDIWMHTKKIPGSHVIIKSHGRDVSDGALYEAANLAAFYSKARNSSSVPVDYTERKNVKKPSGAKPGMVIYYTNRTLYVTPSSEVVENIKNIK